jgi:hypothetical protein
MRRSFNPSKRFKRSSPPIRDFLTKGFEKPDGRIKPVGVLIRAIVGSSMTNPQARLVIDVVQIRCEIAASQVF